MLLHRLSCFMVDRAGKIFLPAFGEKKHVNIKNSKTNLHKNKTK